MASLQTSTEANSDRQKDTMTEKATYRGPSYRSAQKGGFIGFSKVLLNLFNSKIRRSKAKVKVRRDK